MKPWHRTRPRSGSPLMGTASPGGWLASTNLGDLRTAFGPLELRRTGRHRSGGILGEPQLQKVAGRHGVVATDHDDFPEQLLQARCRLARQRRFAAEHSAEEPAGTVDADEPGNTVALA